MDEAGGRRVTSAEGGRRRIPRTRLIRYAKRAIIEAVGRDAVLAEGVVAHVGFASAGQPYVIPMVYLYRHGRLFLHGSKGSRAMTHLASGAPVCVTVTLTDSLVASKAASSHSVNYRSVMVFGRGTAVRGRAAQIELSHAIIGRYFPDRAPGEAYAAITDDELKAVRIVEVIIEEMSGKERAGGPLSPLDADPDALGWNGILPIPKLGSAPDA